MIFGCARGAQADGILLLSSTPPRGALSSAGHTHSQKYTQHTCIENGGAPDAAVGEARVSLKITINQWHNELGAEE
jgi:hypothetical protein